MTLLTRLPAIETPSLVLREIESRDTDAFSGFMMQENYQRHITMRQSPAGFNVLNREAAFGFLFYQQAVVGPRCFAESHA